MGETKHDGLAVPGRAVLAREPAFTLGSVNIDPPTRQVALGGTTQIIEPRVMQVFVVLARAGGAVVSREDLIERCWDGRIVGDDAINHAIGKLRQLASASGGSFGIETIPRVGYRLVAEDAPGSSPLAPGPGSARFSRRVAIASGIALGGVALSAIGSFAVLQRRHQAPPLAKAYYERGLATRGQGYANEYEQAVGYFRKAVEIDPEYADAWGALAWSYRVLFATRERPDSARLSVLSRSAAQRAIAIDADNADARLALLLLQPSYGRWAEVEQGCRHLLSKHPRHSITQFHLAFLLGDTGRWREAIPHMEAVCDREPTWPMARFRLFEELSSAGRVEEADSRLEEAMRLAPRNGDFWTSKIEHLLLTARHDQAASLIDDKSTHPIDGDEMVARQAEIIDAAAGGSREKSKRTVNRLIDGGEHPLYVAKVAAFLGEIDMAFSLVDAAFFGRGRWAEKLDVRPPTHPLFSPATASLRRDPRFAQVLQETGLEAFWRATRTEPDFRRFR